MSLLLFGSVRRPWTPLRLPGLLWWLAADAGVSSQEYLAEFNGTNQSLSIVDNAALSTGDTAFWVAALVVADSLPSTFPVVAGKNATTSANTEWDLHVNQAANQFRFQTGGAAFRTVSHPTVITLGQRYFVMGTHDNVADLNGISLDGSAFTTGATSGTEPTDTASALRVGARNGTPDRFWDGGIGKLYFGKAPIASFATIRDTIWNGGNVLLASELTAQQRTDFGLIPFWPLDEASGQRNDALSTNHLTSNNGVTRRAGSLLTLANASTVSQIRDRSRQANHATQTAYANRPTYRTAIFGAKPAVRFDGTDDVMTMTAIALTGDFTLSIAAAVTSGAYLGHSSGTGAVVQTNTTTLTLTNDAAAALALTHDALDTAVHEVTLVRSGSTITRYLDGLEDGTGTLSGTITVDQLGRVGAATSPLTADLADVVLYDRAYT